jgi:hypothetical protein
MQAPTTSKAPTKIASNAPTTTASNSPTTKAVNNTTTENSEKVVELRSNKKLSKMVNYPDRMLYIVQSSVATNLDVIEVEANQRGVSKETKIRSNKKSPKWQMTPVECLLFKFKFISNEKLTF